MITAYKVVRRKNGRLKSAIPRSRNNREYCQLTYRKGEITQPKFGKILAFDSPEHAYDFLHFMEIEKGEVWRAQAPDAIPITSLSRDSFYGAETLLRNFKLFWGNSYSGTGDTMPTPNGTVACPEIKLIKREKIKLIRGEVEND